MSRRRFFAYFFGILGAVVLGIALYLAFGDLGRHKERIEALVSRSVGRPFIIEGPFSVRLVPVIEVSAERVRLGNMQGGSQPQMVEFGKAVVKIRFWSLISGPPDVQLFELHDATVLLERSADGKGNWEMVPPAEDEEEEPEAEEEKAQVPVVIRMAQLNNVRLIYREPKKHDRVLQLDQLSITPGKEGLLALEGAGKVDDYPLSLKGEAGPIKSLLSARDMRVAMQGTLGKLALDIHGVLGSLDPLDGADLTLKIEHPDLGGMLEKLEVPVIATGPAKVDAQLKDAGERTQLDFNAKAGEFTVATSGTLKSLSLTGADLTLKIDHTEIGNLLKTLELPAIATGPMRIDTRIKDVGERRQLDFKAKLGDIDANLKGSLKTRGLVDSDLKFDVTAANAARLASVFDVKDVPAMPLKVTGHTVYSRKQIKFDALTAALGGASVRVDGTMQHTRDRKAAFRFQMSAESLAKLRASWPVLKVSASGAVELTKGRVEAKDLKAVLGENQLAGSLLLTDEPKHFDVQLSSPRLDLSPFMAKEKQEKGAAAPAPEKPKPEKSDTPKPKFVFDEKPLPLDKMKETNGKLHVSFGELVLAERSFKDVDSNIAYGSRKVDLRLSRRRCAGGNAAGRGHFCARRQWNCRPEPEDRPRQCAGEPGERRPLAHRCAAARPGDEHQDPRQLGATNGRGRQRAPAVDARRGQNQERPDQCLRWRCLVAVIGEAQSLCQGRSVHEARLHHRACRHRQWSSHGEASGHPDREGHHYRRWQDRPAHRETIDRLQYAPAQRHRRESGHVHQPAHSTRRNIGEPKNWHGREGYGIGCAGSCHRRSDGDRGRRGRSHAG